MKMGQLPVLRGGNPDANDGKLGETFQMAQKISTRNFNIDNSDDSDQEEKGIGSNSNSKSGPTSSSRSTSTSGSASKSTSKSTKNQQQQQKKSYQSKSGYLTKLGYNKMIFFGGDSWKRRYFELKDIVLIYKKGESDKQCIAEIYLTTFCEVKLYKRNTRAWADRYDPSYSSGEAWKGTIDRDNCVELRIKATGDSQLSRTFYLQAENRDDARDWCEAIENNINVLKQVEEDRRNLKHLSIRGGGQARIQDEYGESVHGGGGGGGNSGVKMNVMMMSNPDILRRKFLDILASNEHQVLAFYRLALNYEFEDAELLSVLSDFYDRLQL